MPSSAPSPPDARRAFAGSEPSEARTARRSDDDLDVLIVEDNEGDAILVENALRRSGRWRIECTTVKTLADAEACLKHPACTFGLVLLDMRLPDGEGVDALRRLAPLRPETPVVVLTGVEDEGLARACLEAGALDFVQKGVLASREFARTVEFALARSRNLRLKARLEHLDRLAALGEISAGVAHEINNPATYVDYAVSEVQHRLLSLAGEYGASEPGLRAGLEELAHMLDAAKDGMTRIASVVRGLGDYARQRPSAERVVEDPVALCESSLKLVGHQVRHSARLELDLHRCPPIPINPQHFGQVLTNLVLNAAQALEEQPSSEPIRVRLFPARDGVELRVEDSGSGIAAEMQDKIFENFFTTKLGRRGTGLGLGIVRGLVRGAGGTLDFESRKGQGSVFVAWFPAVTSRAAEPMEPSAKPRSLLAGRARVLLVDDDPLVLAALSLGLEQTHEVLQASSGEEALALLASVEGNVDVVCCDMMMPGMDGATTLGRMFERYPRLRDRSFVLSGGATTPRAAAFVSDGAVEVLEKPLPLRTLLRAIDDRLLALRGSA